jgi:Zn-dependent protease with chaperone function
MAPTLVAFEPYRPHLVYTFVIAVIGWVCVSFYAHNLLRYRPAERVALYGLALALPIYAETSTYLLILMRPWLDNVTGHFLLRVHSAVVQRIPIDDWLDTIFTQVWTTTTYGILGVLVVGSLLRYCYGSVQLRQWLIGARPLTKTEYAYLAKQLANRTIQAQRVIPPIQLLPLPVPLAFSTGLLRPHIYVTTKLLDLLTYDEAIAVLCHEWAHVLRHDNHWNWSMRLLRDVTCFLPGSHRMWRAMLVSQDEACDAIAACITGQPLALARALVKVGTATQATSSKLAPPFATKLWDCGNRNMRQRVEAMIRMSNTNLSHEVRSVGPYCLGATMVLLAILPVLLGC